jgi:integrase/recombinase XerD
MIGNCRCVFTIATLRNYLSDLRQFAAWCETSWEEGSEQEVFFTPAAVTTPTITRYRAYLQTHAKLKPASVNRSLVSITDFRMTGLRTIIGRRRYSVSHGPCSNGLSGPLGELTKVSKRYFVWVTEREPLPRDPSKPVKLVAQEPRPPRHLTDRQEEALVAAVTASGHRRDSTLLILMLHTGLRARETCTLKREQVNLGKRSGTLQILGKRNKYREVPLNATARAALKEYLPTLQEEDGYLFPSTKTGQALTERALGQLVKRYAEKAKLPDVHPHDLRHRFGYRMAECQRRRYNPQIAA